MRSGAVRLGDALLVLFPSGTTVNAWPGVGGLRSLCSSVPLVAAPGGDSWFVGGAIKGLL